MSVQIAYKNAGAVPDAGVCLNSPEDRSTASQASRPCRLVKNIMLPILLVGASIGGTVSAAAERTGNKDKPMSQMKITIGKKTFTATIADNATATAFKAMLPLTLSMADANDNEKVAGLSAKLPTKDSNPERIHAGDLMVWTSRSLVFFYKTFPTSYSYTYLGRIDDASGISAAVGSENVTVRFELK